MPNDNSKLRRGVTRREAIKVTAAGIVGGIVFPGLRPLAASAAPPPQGGSGSDFADLGLVNGNFVDHRGFVGNAMTIKNGHIAAVGQLQDLGPDAQVIDLGGKTVIPGLVNTHVHHSRTGRNAGHEARDIETAFSIAELQQVIAARTATVPAGEFISCHLGWHYVQLAENRAPTKNELDAAAHQHPVYISGRAGFVEPFFAVTNSKGQTFFRQAGFSVDGSGRINATPEQCLAALNAVETPEDKLRETFDNNAWTNSLGVTTIFDPAGSPVTAQDYPALELWRQGMLHVRHRLNYSAGTPEVVETRMQNVFRLLGADLLKAGGFGETIGVRSDPATTFEPVARAIAEGGWKIQNHTDFASEVDIQIAAFQNIIADDIPIEKLRWQLIHVFGITPGQLQTLKNLGVGVDVENERYLDRLQRHGGPPFRSIVDSGISIGMGTDGSNFAPNNPWLMMFYATTGVNVRGIAENAAQAITRQEALRLFTAGSAFQSFDDDKGSFDVGKVADLAVLNQDFLTVSDAQLRKTRSVLTIVGGKIVHQGGAPQYAPTGQAFGHTGT